MATRKHEGIRILRVSKGDDLKAIYAKARRAFTAADLQKYTEIEPTYPIEPLIAEMEAIHKEEMRKRRRKKAGNAQRRK